MTPTFYREFKQLNRIAGISLHEKGMLYKVLPDPAHLPAVPKQSRFSVAGVIALLAVAAFVVWFVWYGMGQF
jgi:hypothetical protein